MPASRLDGTSGDPPASPVDPGRLQKTANQLSSNLTWPLRERSTRRRWAWAGPAPPRSEGDPRTVGASGRVRRRVTATPLSVTSSACYRLLLGRQPDADGLAHYRQRLASGQVSLDELVSRVPGQRRVRPPANGTGPPERLFTGETVERLRGFPDPRRPERTTPSATPWRARAVTSRRSPRPCASSAAAGPPSSTSGRTSAGSASWRASSGRPDGPGHRGGA